MTSSSGEEQSMAATKPVRKVNDAFFSVGQAQGARVPSDLDQENRDATWRNIKPNQNVDVLNKEVYKKRKFEEFRQRRDAGKDGAKNGKKTNWQAKKRPKLTPEQDEKLKIQNFIKEIEASLDSKEDNDAFRAAFRKYKLSQHAQIDEFVTSLLGCFLGDKELAVCHLEVKNYPKKKVILLRLVEQVQPRHRDRYQELIECHLQACEKKPRTRNPFASDKIALIKAKAEKAAIEAASASEIPLSQTSQSGHQCCICYKSENLYEAKCRHIACLPCWETWLEKALECPTCRQRTRKNQIFPILLQQQPQTPVQKNQEESKTEQELSPERRGRRSSTSYSPVKQSTPK